MQLVGEPVIAALGPKPRTTKPAPGHKIYADLLQGLTVERPNQVRAANITYVLVNGGFLAADHALGKPLGVGVAAVVLEGCVVLRVGAGGGAGALRLDGIGDRMKPKIDSESAGETGKEWWVKGADRDPAQAA